MKNKYKNSRSPAISIFSFHVYRSKGSDCQTVLKKSNYMLPPRQIQKTQIDGKLKEFKSYTTQIVAIKELG